MISKLSFWKIRKGIWVRKKHLTLEYPNFFQLFRAFLQISATHRPWLSSLVASQLAVQRSLDILWHKKSVSFCTAFMSQKNTRKHGWRFVIVKKWLLCEFSYFFFYNLGFKRRSNFRTISTARITRRKCKKKRIMSRLLEQNMWKILI